MFQFYRCWSLCCWWRIQGIIIRERERDKEKKRMGNAYWNSERIMPFGKTKPISSFPKSKPPKAFPDLHWFKIIGWNRRLTLRNWISEAHSQKGQGWALKEIRFLRERERTNRSCKRKIFLRGNCLDSFDRNLPINLWDRPQRTKTCLLGRS